MSKSLTWFTKSVLLAGICAGLAVSAAGQTGAKISSLHLRVYPSGKEPPGYPCGGYLNVDAHVTVSGKGKLWYRFEGPAEANFAGGPEGTTSNDVEGEDVYGKGVTFTKDTKGQFRVEVAVVGANGNHGPVTVSNIVPFDFKCGGGGTAGSSMANQPSGEGLSVTGVTLTFPPSLTMWKYSGVCPLKLDLYGHITATGSGQVRFQMLPEGHPGIWPEEFLDFSGPGTKHVHKILSNLGSNVWKPGSHHTGWYILKVLSPQQMESNRVEYDVTCR